MIFSAYPLRFPEEFPMVEKKVTIATLHTLLHELIKENRTRFDGIDKRFDGMDGRLDGLDKRMDGTDSRLNRLESVQNSMALRLISVETTVKEHTRLLGSLQIRVDSLHGLAEKLERR